MNNKEILYHTLKDKLNMEYQVLGDHSMKLLINQATSNTDNGINQMFSQPNIGSRIDLSVILEFTSTAVSFAAIALEIYNTKKSLGETLLKKDLDVKTLEKYDKGNSIDVNKRLEVLESLIRKIDASNTAI